MDIVTSDVTTYKCVTKSLYNTDKNWNIQSKITNSDQSDLHYSDWSAKEPRVKRTSGVSLEGRLGSCKVIQYQGLQDSAFIDARSVPCVHEANATSTCSLKLYEQL